MLLDGMATPPAPPALPQRPSGPRAPMDFYFAPAGFLFRGPKKNPGAVDPGQIRENKIRAPPGPAGSAKKIRAPWVLAGSAKKIRAPPGPAGPAKKIRAPPILPTGPACWAEVKANPYATGQFQPLAGEKNPAAGQTWHSQPKKNPGAAPAQLAQ